MNILDTIVQEKHRELAVLPARNPSAEELRLALKARGDRRDFVGALRCPRRGNMALIAEVKKASPSAGVIREDFDPVKIAREYERAGASCLSVLTDRKFFQGSLEYLKRIRQEVELPLLRKDFILDERQLLEAIDYGADAILLIVTILDDVRLRELLEKAQFAGLMALVEVHDEGELARALAAGATLIGVNNRDLRTFQVDLATTEKVASRLQRVFPDGTHRPLLVAESGIHHRSDVERLRAAGAQAILVGESLMREDSVASKIDHLLGSS